MTAPRSLFSTFSADPELERDGVVLDFGDFRFRVARAGGSNKRFQSAVRRILDPHKRAIDLEVLADEKSRELVAECFAEAVILGWESKFVEDGKDIWKPIVIGKDGREIEFSKQNCKELLISLPDLFDTLRAEATKLANFNTARRESAAQD
ncbi:MAG: hypothetical protein HC923_07590 [Myxococcales bacterium]|nr:hypothetical protein [Myxococcales bacterium]